MIPTRTDDLRFAEWLGGALPVGFEVYRKVAYDGDDLSAEALSALVADLRRATPAHLQQEVCYGLWEGHQGLFGGGIVPDTRPLAGGAITRTITSAARLGSRITAFGDRHRSETAAWLDDQIHKRIELSGRRYLLFRGRLEPVTRWARDRGPVLFRHSPDLIWPDDHSWIVTAPPGEGFAVVAGGRELADLIDSDPGLRTL